MKILESLKRTIESIEAKKAPKSESEDGFDIIKAKYTEVPPEVLESIINDVKTECGRKMEEDIPEEPENADDALQANEEDLNKVEIEPAEGKPVAEPHKTDTLDSMNELDASEDGVAGETPEDYYTEDEDEIDDELIISEEDEPTEELPPAEVVDDEIAAESDEDDFDIYQDELDVVDADEPVNETGEDAEKIDMSIPERENSDDAADAALKERRACEDAEKIDLNIPSDDNSTDAADKAAKEIKNEDNSGAKAAIANRDNKGAFSSDVDALTEYLDKY